MLRPEQVPEAVAYEVYRRFEMDTEREAAEAIAAAINAWPGVVKNYSWDASHGRIILPLPQENTND